MYKDNTTLMLVTFKDAISSDETTNAVEKLRDMTDERCKVSGMTSALIDTRDLSDKEVAIYVLIAVALCIIILELALDSYLVPIFLLLNIGNVDHSQTNMMKQRYLALNVKYTAILVLLTCVIILLVTQSILK